MKKDDITSNVKSTTIGVLTNKIKLTNDLLEIFTNGVEYLVSEFKNTEDKINMKILIIKVNLLLNKENSNLDVNQKEYSMLEKHIISGRKYLSA